LNLNDVPIPQFDAIPEAERIRPKEMDMNITGAAVTRVFEMMMFQIAEAM
jgi:hypothetical protein